MKMSKTRTNTNKTPEIKQLWEEFNKVQTRQASNGMTLIKTPWRWFKGGTPKDIIHTWFEKGCIYSDAEIEKYWSEFETVETRENNDGEVFIKNPWQWFKAGTPLEIIHQWFDNAHSKGLMYLIFGIEE